MQPNRRARLLDRIVTRSLALPKPTNDYSVERDLRIPMRDGTVQLADLYQPVGPSAGLVVSRSPYGWGAFTGAMSGAAFAARGYTALLARCRGTFGSGGEFEPWIHEIDDGADTVAWLREQSWFPGTFATYGGSYLGFTQWAILLDPPPELRAAVILTGPHDFADAMYQGGALRLIDWLGWAEQVGRQEQPNFRSLVKGHLQGRKRVPPAADELPLSEAGERLLRGTSGWYQQWIRARDRNDPLFDGMDLTAAIERVQVPVLLQTGWHDPFLLQTFDEYARLRDRNATVALSVGPWTHGEMITKGVRMIVNEAMAWYDEHLSGRGGPARPAPVKYFTTGSDEWHELSAWPPATVEHVLHPTPTATLADAPAHTGSEARFTYDPATPTPTIGGSILLGGGYKDDSALAERADVLTFTTDALTAPIELLGCAIAEIAHRTDNPHVDLFVRLSDVDPKGRSRNICEGFQRLGPAAANGTIAITLDPTAHRFLPGHRLRLLIAGGSHPCHERNLGTGDDPATTSRTEPSNRVVDLCATRLVLPVAPDV